MEIRSAVAGAFATVAVGVGVFFAVSAGNAAEPVVVEAPAVVGHYSTVESQDPIVYVPEPVAVEPVVEAPPADIPVEVPMIEPAPVPAPEPVAAEPAPAPADAEMPAGPGPSGETYVAPSPPAAGDPQPQP